MIKTFEKRLRPVLITETSKQSFFKCLIEIALQKNIIDRHKMTDNFGIIKFSTKAGYYFIWLIIIV